MSKEAKFLRKRADECEAIGIGQYKRSANHTGFGYTEFNNARIWGQKAQFYREAARELDEEFKS